MAVTSNTPQPIQAGFRLNQGDLLNGYLAEGLASTMTGIVALAGGGATGATVLLSRVSEITTCATAGDSVALPAAVLGTIRIVQNNGAASALVWRQGTNTIGTAGTNFVLPAGAVAFVFCTATGVWQYFIQFKSGLNPAAQFNAISGGTPLTLTGAQMAGAESVFIQLTANLGGAGTLNSATAAQIIAAIPNAQVGYSYNLRIINSSAGAFAWTLTTATGVTLTGTMTIAKDTQRDFVVTVTSATTVTIQSLGTVAVTGV